MNDQMNAALADLQDSLTEINDWAELIKTSERAAAGAIKQATESINATQNVIRELQAESQISEKNLRATSRDVKDAVDKLLSQSSEDQRRVIEGIKKEAETTHSNLRSTGDQVKSDVNKIIQSYRDLASSTADLVDYLKSVNFPARLDKLDTSVSAINSSVGNLSDKLDLVRDQLTSKLENSLQQMEQQLKANQQLAEQHMKAMQQKQNTWFGILTALMVIVLGLAIYLVAK